MFCELGWTNLKSRSELGSALYFSSVRVSSIFRTLPVSGSVATVLSTV
jgi:hypothetical protein